MTKRLDTIDLYLIELTLETAGGVLVPQVSGVSEQAPDAVPVTDENGKAHLPATSIAGSLRAHALDRLGDTGRVQGLFGSPRPERSQKSDGKDLMPSTLRVLNSVSDKLTLVSEMSTAIDRERGAARSSSLREVEYLERGTQFTIYLRADNLNEGLKQDLELVLRSWHPLLGSSVSSGKGEARTRRVARRTLDLRSPDDLIIYLSTGGPALFQELNDLEVFEPSRPEKHVFEFVLAGPMHVGGPATGNTQLFHRVAGEPTIPARSIRGLFRSRIDYMLSTLGLANCRLPDTCNSCISCQLFGFTSQGASSRSSLRFADSTIRNTQATKLMHVAIDRFTGGARDSALFEDEVMEAGTFTVTIERLGGSDELWQAAGHLLRIVAEDANAGFVRFGASAARGYGRVHLDRSSLDLTAAQHWLANYSITEVTVSTSYRHLCDRVVGQPMLSQLLDHRGDGMTWTLSGARLPWEEARSHLENMIFQWQDLDGLHWARLPVVPPPTSLLHGWSTDGSVRARIRLDRDTAHLAVLASDGTHIGTEYGQPDVIHGTTKAWGASNGRVAQFRFADDRSRNGLDQKFDVLEVIDLGEGGLSFYAAILDT